MAEQYGRCQTEKDKLIKENIELKQSLKECELMLTKKMKSDNETWNEMETFHYELKERLNVTQLELQRYKSLAEQQLQQIHSLEKLLTANNEQNTSSKQTENRLRDEIKMHQTKIKSLKSTLSKSQQIIHDKQCKINKLSKLQKSKTKKKTFISSSNKPIKPIMSPIENNLDGTLGATLKILHEELYQSLRPQIYLLWKKWIYALMQHFENKLSALNINHYHGTDIDISQSIQQLDDIYSNVEDKIHQKNPLRIYNEPRVIVRYKKKRKTARTRANNSNSAKTHKTGKSLLSPRKKGRGARNRSHTLSKSSTKSSLTDHRLSNAKRKMTANNRRHVKMKIVSISVLI